MNNTESNADRGVGWAARATRFLSAVVGPLLALLCVVAFFAAADWWLADEGAATFWTARNLRTVTVQTCVVAVAALGMTVVIIAGGIDLSAGTALALCATVLAWGLREDVAVLAWRGENFASASRQLEQAQAALAEAEASEHERWSAVVARRRELLLSIATAKRELSRRRLAFAQGERDRAAAERQLAGWERRVAELHDPEFRLQANRAWLQDVPNSAYTAPLAIMMSLATGLAAGALNGALVSSLRVAPFIVTLGAMTVYLGLGNLISGNVPIRPSGEQTPAWLSAITRNTPDSLWFGFPYGVWLALLLAVLLAAVLKFSVFGRHVFAIGSNEATARLCGISTGWVKTGVYALCGLFLGVAGVYQFSRLSVGNPSSGLGLELRVIAAVVIGGASLGGGRGTVVGTLTGAAIMAVIASGCTQLGLENHIQDIILGVIIVGAVTVDQIRQRRQERTRAAA